MKELYTRMNEHITPSAALVNATVNAAKPARPRKTRRLAFIPVLALMLALVVVTPALASSNAEFNALLYRLVPDVALYFRPVNRSATDQGITVSVLAVDVVGPQAELYVAVSGEGVDETIDFFDSYSLDRPSDTSAGCWLHSYDEATQTAIFYINYRLLDGTDIAATDKVTFRVGRMLRNKQEQTVPVIAGRKLPTAEAKTTSVARYGLNGIGINGWGGSSTEDCPTDKAMATGQMYLPIVDGLTITAAGMVDGQYRIQVHSKDNLHTDNHAFLYLVDAQGNIVHPAWGISFSERDAEGTRQRYDEDVFAITPAELANYTLYADTVTADPAIQGDWAITFPLVDYAAE